MLEGRSFFSGNLLVVFLSLFVCFKTCIAALHVCSAKTDDLLHACETDTDMSVHMGHPLFFVHWSCRVSVCLCVRVWNLRATCPWWDEESLVPQELWGCCSNRWVHQLTSALWPHTQDKGTTRLPTSIQCHPTCHTLRHLSIRVQ